MKLLLIALTLLLTNCNNEGEEGSREPEVWYTDTLDVQATHLGKDSWERDTIIIKSREVGDSVEAVIKDYVPN